MDELTGILTTESNIHLKAEDIFLKSVCIYLKGREIKRVLAHWIIAPMATTGWARLKSEVDNSLNFTFCWQEAKYLSHHLLPSRVHISRKLELVVQPGLKLWYFQMGISSGVEFCTKCLPLAMNFKDWLLHNLFTSHNVCPSICETQKHLTSVALVVLLCFLTHLFKCSHNTSTWKYWILSWVSFGSLTSSFCAYGSALSSTDNIGLSWSQENKSTKAKRCIC